MSVYESPVKRRLRAAIGDTADDVLFAERLVDAIDNDPDVREAIRRLTAAAPKRQPRPTTAQRGGRR